MTARNEGEWIRLDRDPLPFVDEARGLAVIERPTPPPGGARGVAFAATGCTKRECACTDVNLDGGVLDASVEAVRFADRPFAIQVQGATSIEPFSLTLELTTGDLAVPEGRTAPASLDLEWLRSTLDGALLDRLWTAFLRAKRIVGVDRPVGLGDVRFWATGRKMFFNEVFTNARLDRYRVGDSVVDVAEAHCADYRCRCDSVLLDFMAGPAEALKEKARSIGQVEVRLSEGAGDRAEPSPHEPGDRELLEEAYRLYRRRHPSAERLRSRTALMRAALRPVVERLTATVPARSEGPRRNDPCPCGSGKKFKNCCGATDSRGS